MGPVQPGEEGRLFFFFEDAVLVDHDDRRQLETGQDMASLVPRFRGTRVAAAREMPPFWRALATPSM